MYLSHLTTKNSEWCRLIDPWTTKGFYWFHRGIAGLWAEGRMQCRTNVQLECSWMMWSVMGRCNTHTQTHARAYKYTHIHVHTHTQYALIQWQWHTQTRIHTDTLTCIHIVHKLTHIGKQIQLQHVIATLWDSLHWKVYLDVQLVQQKRGQRYPQCFAKIKVELNDVKQIWKYIVDSF